MLIVWSFIKNLFTFAWKNKQIAIIIIMALLIAFLSCQNRNKNNAIDLLNNKNKTLADNLNLQVNGTKVVYRDKDKIVYKYLPAEGKITESKPDAKGNVIVKIKDFGLTFKFGGAVLYDGKMDGALDIKLGFYNRYSLGISSSLTSANIWGSRHIDDLTLGVIQNAEFMIGWGKPYDNFSNSLLIIGLRVNL